MSHKNLDKKGRLRSVIVSFRVSAEESEMINNLVKISGMTKQDYIIDRLSNRDFSITPNPRVFIGLKLLLENVLMKFEKSKNPTDDILDTINIVANLLNNVNS